MICKKCGASIPDEALFCPICGASCAAPAPPAEPMNDQGAATVALPREVKPQTPNRPPQYHQPPARPQYRQTPPPQSQPARQQPPANRRPYPQQAQQPQYPPAPGYPQPPQNQHDGQALPAQDILTPDQFAPDRFASDAFAPEQYIPDAPAAPEAPEKHSKIGRIIVICALVFALVIGAGGGFTTAWFLYGQHKINHQYWIAEKVVLTCMDALVEEDQSTINDVLVSDNFLCAYYIDQMSRNGKDWEKIFKEDYGNDIKKVREDILKYAADKNSTAFLFFSGGEVTFGLKGYAEEQTFDFGKGDPDQLEDFEKEKIIPEEVNDDAVAALRSELVGKTFSYDDGKKEETFTIREVRVFTVDKDAKVRTTLVKLEGEKAWRVLSMSADNQGS